MDCSLPYTEEMDIGTSNEDTVTEVAEDRRDSLQYQKPVILCSDHAYHYQEREVPVFCDSATQTDLTMDGIEQIQKDYTDLSSKLSNKDKLLRDMVVDKVTSSDKHVKKYTGVPSKAVLDGLFDVLDQTEPNMKYWSGKKSAPEMSYQESGKAKPGPRRKLSRYEEFLLTLLKLRLSLLTFVLGDLFGIAESRVSQIFSTWINYMHVVLVPLIKWPSRQKVQKYMPLSFKMSFPKTRSIIDCTEIFIQKPKSPTAQSSTYSNYKSHNTFKVLFGITPAGAFSFVSDLWGGNTSDRFITANSGYLDLVSPNDEIMADRGFVIRDLLTERRATLNIPPFTRKCKYGKGRRLNANEVKKTKFIARLRIHVERAIQRLKTFSLLAGILDLKLKPLTNQIVKVAAFLCNLSKPLVKK